MPATRQMEKKNGEQAEPTKENKGNGNNGELKANVLKWFKTESPNRWVKSSTICKGVSLDPNKGGRNRVRKVCQALEKQGLLSSKKEKRNYQYHLGKPEETVVAEPEKKAEKTEAVREAAKTEKPKEECANGEHCEPAVTVLHSYLDEAKVKQLLVNIRTVGKNKVARLAALSKEELAKVYPYLNRKEIDALRSRLSP